MRKLTLWEVIYGCAMAVACVISYVLMTQLSLDLPTGTALRLGDTVTRGLWGELCTDPAALNVVAGVLGPGDVIFIKAEV